MSRHALTSNPMEVYPWTKYRIVTSGFSAPRVESQGYLTVTDTIAAFLATDSDEVSIWVEGYYPGYGWMELEWGGEGEDTLYRSDPDDWWDAHTQPTGRRAYRVIGSKGFVL